MTRRFVPSDLTEKPADQMTEEECRREYRSIRKRSGMEHRAFDDEARTFIRDASEADPSEWVRAARAVCQTCPKCRGTGRYVWGAIVNGRPTHQGPCFACNGQGRIDDADIRRNWGYWNHYARIA